MPFYGGRFRVEYAHFDDLAEYRLDRRSFPSQDPLHIGTSIKVVCYKCFRTLTCGPNSYTSGNSIQVHRTNKWATQDVELVRNCIQSLYHRKRDDMAKNNASRWGPPHTDSVISSSTSSQTTSTSSSSSSGFGTSQEPPRETDSSESTGSSKHSAPNSSATPTTSDIIKTWFQQRNSSGEGSDKEPASGTSGANLDGRQLPSSSKSDTSGSTTHQFIQRVQQLLQTSENQKISKQKPFDYDNLKVTKHKNNNRYVSMPPDHACGRVRIVVKDPYARKRMLLFRQEAQKALDTLDKTEKAPFMHLRSLPIFKPPCAYQTLQIFDQNTNFSSSAEKRRLARQDYLNLTERVGYKVAFLVYYMVKHYGKFCTEAECKKHVYVSHECVKAFAYCIYCRHILPISSPSSCQQNLHLFARHKNTRSNLECKKCLITEPRKPNLYDVNGYTVPWNEHLERKLEQAMFEGVRPERLDTGLLWSHSRNNNFLKKDATGKLICHS